MLQDQFWLAFAAFFVTIDPLGMIPVFLGVTAGLEAKARRRAALIGVGVGAGVLAVFAFLGEATLTALGVTLPAFRIAGGLMLLAIAFEMVFERRTKRRGDSAEHIRDDLHGHDVAVFPIAVPLIAGPGAIAAVILQVSAAQGEAAALATVASALVACLATLMVALLLAAEIGRFLPASLVQVLSRVLGLLLGALAVQFVLDGVRAAFLA